VPFRQAGRSSLTVTLWPHFMLSVSQHLLREALVTFVGVLYLVIGIDNLKFIECDATVGCRSGTDR
jgi:hypothetical protein